MGRPASCGLGGTRTDISGRTRAWPGGGGRGWRAGRGGDTLASGKVVQLRKKPVTVGIPVARPSVRTRACAANADGSYLWFWRQNTHWCTVAGFGPLATGPRVVQKIVFTSTGFFDSAVVAASPAFIRLPHRYYVVRLPASVHMGLTLFAFSHQTVAVRQRMLNNGASRFSCVRFLYMHGVCASEEPAAHSRFPRAAVLPSGWPDTVGTLIWLFWSSSTSGIPSLHMPLFNAHDRPHCSGSEWFATPYSL
jgi:hypothetical protein